MVHLRSLVHTFSLVHVVHLVSYNTIVNIIIKYFCRKVKFNISVINISTFACGLLSRYETIFVIPNTRTYIQYT